MLNHVLILLLGILIGIFITHTINSAINNVNESLIGIQDELIKFNIQHIRELEKLIDYYENLKD